MSRLPAGGGVGTVAVIMRAFIVIAGLVVVTLTAQQPDAILSQLSSEATNVLVVRDPLPVLEQVLASPVAEQFLRGTAGLQRRSFARAFDAAELRLQLALVAPLIPCEVVVAWPTRTMDRLSHTAALFACHASASVLVSEGQGDGEDVAALRAAAADCLVQLDSLPLQAWVRTRDERTAENWFDAVADTLRKRADALGLSVKVEGSQIEVRATPFAAGGPLHQRLAEVGFDVAKAPANELRAAIEQQGTRLSLRIGTLAPGPCPAARFGDQWRTGSLLFGRTEVSDAKASFTAAYLGIVALGKAKGETAELMTRLLGFLGRMDALCSTQIVSLSCDRGIAWTHATSASAADIATVPPRLLRLFAEGEPMYVTSDTLDVVLEGLLEAVAEGELPTSAPGRPLADFLEGDDARVFAPGVAVAVRGTTMRGTADGTRATLPFAAVALVAPVPTPTDAAPFVREVTKHIATMVRGSKDVWRERDLGLGVTTHALALDAVAPVLVQRELDRDFRPHWFVADDLFVVSTDPSLSKDLLARVRGDGPGRAPTGLLQRVFARGATFADYAAGMKLWVPVVSGWLGEPVDERVPFFDAIRAVISLVESFEMRAELADGTLRSTATLRLRDAK